MARWFCNTKVSCLFQPMCITYYCICLVSIWWCQYYSMLYISTSSWLLLIIHFISNQDISIQPATINKLPWSLVLIYNNITNRKAIYTTLVHFFNIDILRGYWTVLWKNLFQSIKIKQSSLLSEEQTPFYLFLGFVSEWNVCFPEMDYISDVKVQLRGCSWIR